MLLPIQGEVDWETKRFAKNSWKLTGQCNWSLVKAANSSVYNSENHRMCFAVLRWWSWTFFASSTKYSRNSRSRSEWNRQFRFIRPFLLICVADSLNLRYMPGILWHVRQQHSPIETPWLILKLLNISCYYTLNSLSLLWLVKSIHWKSAPVTSSSCRS